MKDKEKAILKDLILENIPKKGRIESSKLASNISEDIQKVRSVLGELCDDSRIKVNKISTKDFHQLDIYYHPDFFFEKDFYLNKFLQEEKEKELSKAPTIQNSGNLVMGDIPGSLNQSLSGQSTHTKTVTSTPQKTDNWLGKRMNKIIGGIILGITTWAIIEYIVVPWLNNK